MHPNRLKRLEIRLERWLWRFRLVAILPVVMSLFSTALAFAIGTMEIVKALSLAFSPEVHSKTWSAELLGDLPKRVSKPAEHRDFADALRHGIEVGGLACRRGDKSIGLEVHGFGLLGGIGHQRRNASTNPPSTVTIWPVVLESRSERRRK